MVGVYVPVLGVYVPVVGVHVYVQAQTSDNGWWELIWQNAPLSWVHWMLYRPYTWSLQPKAKLAVLKHFLV